MIDKKSVELLAPAGTWDAFTAAVDAGADAVYLGGKHFNMRVHRNDFNLDDDDLQRAVAFAHEHNVKLYITINNLISAEELPALENYLAFLDKLQPDALIVQDFAVVKLVRDMRLNLPIHASIMMNIHNAPALETLKTFGIKRVVVSRELSLAHIAALKIQTGVETECFIHGDMCICESGQCIHSGVVFGQSGNRGRCLKPCRWSYRLIDETTGEILDDFAHRLAYNDMCMLRNIPELIAANVDSLKIEGRMRPPEFIHRIVSMYRRALDRYFDDPTGYSIDDDDWNDLFDNRVRNFTTSFMFGRPTKRDVGMSGEREPRFFSKATLEATVDDPKAAEIFADERSIRAEATPQLSVRVSTVDGLKATEIFADERSIRAEATPQLSARVSTVDGLKATEIFADERSIRAEATPQLSVRVSTVDGLKAADTLTDERSIRAEVTPQLSARVSTVDGLKATEIFTDERSSRAEATPELSVRVSTVDGLKAAVDNGADVVYVGGEVFQPLKPLTIDQLIEAIEYTHSLNKKIFLNTPRTTYKRELDELNALLSTVDLFDERPDGVMVGNLGSLTLAKKFSLPIRADVSFNLFNQSAAALIKELGASMAAASLELSFSQLRSLVEQSPLPIEVIIHGALETMICEHNFASMALGLDALDDSARNFRQYALVDEAGEVHSQRVDQYGRTHLYFGRDLCLLPYLEKFSGAASLRIDAQLYSSDQIARLVSMYRRALDGQSVDEPLHIEGERPIGVGVYRFRQSKNS